jgi:hypothetical protein
MNCDKEGGGGEGERREGSGRGGSPGWIGTAGSSVKKSG